MDLFNIFSSFDFKKRFFRYLLNHYLGQFLEQKFSLDQLEVEVSSGKWKALDVALDCQMLNKMAEEESIPIEFIEARAGCISVSVPWTAMTTENAEVDVHDLVICVQPKLRTETGNSMLNSMFTSMASSMHLAQDFLKTVEREESNYYDSNTANASMPGLDACANAIEAFLSRVKVNFKDTIVRVQRVYRSSAVIGVGLEVHIQSWNYMDEQGTDVKDTQRLAETSHAYKKFSLQGIKLYTDVMKNGSQSAHESIHSESDDLLLIGSFTGAAEVKLKIKTNEQVGGPQVAAECNFGSLLSILSPFQLHLLNLILEDFLDPPSSSETYGFNSQMTQKPMDSFDFTRVQEELEKGNRQEGMGFAPMPQQGWSSGYEDESHDQFFAFDAKPNMMMNSITSNLMENSVISTASSMNQSMSDSMSTSFGLKSEVSDNSPHRYRTYGGAGSTVSHAVINGDRIKVTVSIASAAVVLLLDDIVSISLSMGAAPSTVDTMRKLSNQFFETAGILNTKKTSEIQAILNRSCPNHSYLSFVASPVKVEMFCGMDDALPLNHGHVTVGILEVGEVLKSDKLLPGQTEYSSKLLAFSQVRTSESMHVEFRHKAFKTSTPFSKITLRIRLQDCFSELDLSILDRLNGIFRPQHALLQGTGKLNNEGSSSSSRSATIIKLSATEYTVDFKFPIPDLRPSEDPDRLPAGIRNVRDDSIVFCLKDATFDTTLNSLSEVLHFDVQCHEGLLYYKAYPNADPLYFARTTCDDPNKDKMSLVGFDRPRVTVTLFPRKKGEITNDGATNVEEDSLANLMSLESFKSAPSPFSSKRVLHECRSSDAEDQGNTNGFGESVTPGDADEMKSFMDSTVSDVMYKVDCSLRFVEVKLPSKQFFEDLYNRLTMDLLLWEPATFESADEPSDQFKGFRQGPTEFSMCKSGIRLDSDSEDEEVHSFTGAPAKPNFKRNKKSTTASGQSEVTINLDITYGVCSFFTPFEDAAGKILPELKGQITLEIERGNVFVVSGYKGDTNLGYLCVRSEKASFYHNDLVRSAELLPLGDPTLKKTIFPSETGVLAARPSESGAADRDMLAVAIKIAKDGLKNLKVFKVAVGIKNGTIDYIVAAANRTWFTQIVDFFDVFDAPIAGYTPSTVLTELHLHLSNCAAVYTPVNLPLRGVLTMQNFSVSVNIAAQTNMKVISFLAEDAALFITNKKTSSDLRHDYVCVMDMDLFDLVLRICLNLPGANSLAPQLELKASNNLLHIRTCSDSMKMLIELITYFVNGGDQPNTGDKYLAESDEQYLNGPDSTNKTSNNDCEDFMPSVSSGVTNPVIPMSEEDRQSSEHLHTMVAEAMQENILGSTQPPRARKLSSTLSESYSSTSGDGRKFTHQTLELHFEDEKPEDEDTGVQFDADEPGLITPAPPKYMEPFMESCNGLPVSLQMSDEDEEEFCILEDVPGVGLLPQNGEPEVKILTEKPIEMIDNHFAAPSGKADILQAPKHYPKPVMKFTVQEMSLIWHMYGGEDFGTSMGNRASSSTRLSRTSVSESSETLNSDGGRTEYDAYDNYGSEIDLAVDALSTVVGYTKMKAFESAHQAYESPRNKRRNSSGGGKYWRASGGKNRNHDVLVEFALTKVRFQHEIYPSHTEQASRQVLVINSVEILDKLKSSDYNKMLYLYTSPTRPKQSFANMVVVKAAHVRPDPKYATIEECCLKISLLPIRLNVDQDTVFFLYQFFTGLATGAGDTESEDTASTSSAKLTSHTPSMESLPVMMINNAKEGGDNATPVVPPADPSTEEESGNLLGFDDYTPPPRVEKADDNVSECSKDVSVDSLKQPGPVYFREVIFSPDVPIRLDYRGKNVYDMTSLGPIAGILMALGQLESAEVKLIRLHNNRGVLGGQKLANYFVTEWVNDMRKNQVPGVLGGVDLVIPMHSFVQLYQGFKDLFVLPVEQYQKDGRLGKGLQRGVNSFSTSAATAVLKLANRVVQAFQVTAELTYDLVSPGPSMQQQRRQSTTKKKRYAQPTDIREGVANAYIVVREGLGDTAHTMMSVASKGKDQSGVAGAVGGVLRQIPSTVVKPIILVAEATSNVLEGLRSQLEPDVKKEAEEKWKET